MSYIGNTPTQQNFVAGADQFSGNGSTVAFTLSRSVNTVFDIFVTVANVPQDPFTAYTVSGNTLTFDGAPPSGTNNIDVVYRATNVQTFVPSPGVSQQFAIGTAAAPGITFIGDTNTGIYSPGADTIAFTEGGTEIARFDSAGNFGLATSSPFSTSGAAVLTVGGSSSSKSGRLFLRDASNNNQIQVYISSTFNEFNSQSELNVRTEAGALRFTTANTERARFNDTGAFVLAGGTTTANGIGITFPATQSASSNANTLDDYEEGTFAAFLSDGTNNTSTGAGSYVKVGKAVSVQIQIYNATYSGLTAGSLLRLSGLPFPVNDTCNAPISFPLSTYQCLMTQNSFSGTTSLGLFTTGSTPVDWVSATRTRIGGTSISIYASFVYYT